MNDDVADKTRKPDAVCLIKGVRQRLHRILVQRDSRRAAIGIDFLRRSSDNVGGDGGGRVLILRQNDLLRTRLQAGVDEAGLARTELPAQPDDRFPGQEAHLFVLHNLIAGLLKLTAQFECLQSERAHRCDELGVEQCVQMTRRPIGLCVLLALGQQLCNQCQPPCRIRQIRIARLLLGHLGFLYLIPESHVVSAFLCCALSRKLSQLLFVRLHAC